MSILRVMIKNSGQIPWRHNKKKFSRAFPEFYKIPLKKETDLAINVDLKKSCCAN